MRYFFFLSILFLSIVNLSQGAQFSKEILENTNSLQKEVPGLFAIEEIRQFVPSDNELQIILPNGLRSAKYVDVKNLEALESVNTIAGISIVFSKYPIRKNGGYQMNMQLLQNRLNNLFQLKSELNSDEIEWKIVLQTDCLNDEQVDSLFHGVIIHLKESEHIDQNNSVSSVDKEKSIQKIVPSGNEFINYIEHIESMDDLPAHVKRDLEGANVNLKTEILSDYFLSIINDTSVAIIDDEFLNNHSKLVDNFIKRYSYNTDKVVYEVFDRNPQWKRSLVIADWTGSMYGYGSQALQWHIENFKTSGIEYFTLFNDGDLSNDKKIGETGGIYHNKADDIHKVVAQYQFVMMQGSGGDGPENDLEAIIKGIEKYPDHSEVILIADNNACVRDMALLEMIKEPVRVIICGFNTGAGINEQYVNIARKTGGSIHTIEMDLEDLQKAEIDKNRLTLMDYEVKITKAPCYQKRGSGLPLHDVTFYTAPNKKNEKTTVVNLDLTKQNLKKCPTGLKSMTNLNYLDLSNNNIESVGRRLNKVDRLNILKIANNRLSYFPNGIENMRFLKELDLSGNAISSIPYSLNYNKYLIMLDLSNNEIEEWPETIKLKYLEVLDLSDNQLTELPDKISDLRLLQELDLSDNKLSNLPEKVKYLKKLSQLDVSKNYFNEVPEVLYKMKFLDILVVKDCGLLPEQLDKLQYMLPKTTVIYK